METMLATKTDSEIQQDVLRELRWDSRIRETEVGVEVDKGVVTLTGVVESFPKKLAAREAAHRVVGVLDVADDVQVKIPALMTRSDTDIAQAVRQALEWDVFVPDTRIRSTVSNSWVTLEGEVDTLMDRVDAERVVRRLLGVRGVVNNITVSAPRVDSARVRDAIEEALERRAERAAGKIDIRVEDGRVTVSGAVRSWPEKEAVLGAAREAPGVRAVVDRLRLEPYS
jgi:osmotically-inducible protein OsmY